MHLMYVFVNLLLSCYIIKSHRASIDDCMA